MKRIFLIFLCLTLLGTLCACRVRLIADPAQADTILQAQQEAQPPQRFFQARSSRLMRLLLKPKTACSPLSLLSARPSTAR